MGMPPGGALKKREGDHGAVLLVALCRASPEENGSREYISFWEGGGQRGDMMRATPR